jgi:hypothetical protein
MRQYLTTPSGRCSASRSRRAPVPGTRSSTTPSTTTPGSPTPRSSTTSGRRPAAAFWLRAQAFFADYGIEVKRVLTDNGSCYRSNAFRDALSEQVRHKRTRPYRPQTNGKVGGSTAYGSRNGPTRPATCPRPTAPPRSPRGCITTTTTAATRSKASRPPAEPVSPTSVVSTADDRDHRQEMQDGP